MTIAPMSGLEAGGLARSSDDPTMRAVLLLTMDLGIVFIRQVVEGLLGASITDPDVVNRGLPRSSSF